MGTSLKPIQNSNVEDVSKLLFQRNGTLKEYVFWKYFRDDDNIFRGLLLYRDDIPIGCFGSVPRKIRVVNGESINCIWFADWYVSNEYRGEGYGRLLLKGLLNMNMPVFGHPQPEKARKICLEEGFNKIDFQSHRRIVLRKYQYERYHTTNCIKALIKLSHNNLRSLLAKCSSLSSDFDKDDVEPLLSFSEIERYRDWICSQPTTSNVARKLGEWNYNNLNIVYMDDLFSESEFRRRVLYISGNSKYRIEWWKKFLLDTLNAGRTYIDLFTTEKKLDQIWQRLGAVSGDNRPILVKNFEYQGKLVLHGWDRENWTYQAY